MSSDKRLGVNPLSWVDPQTAEKAQEINIPTEAISNVPTTTPAKALGGGLFLPPGNITKEDLMSKGKVKVKQSMDTAQAVAHLEDLANSLTAGIVRAEDGKNSVVLCAADTVQFEMKLSHKKDKSKIEIEMEWADDGTKIENFKITNE